MAARPRAPWHAAASLPIWLTASHRRSHAMKLDLTNKRAIVTGSSAGIGFAIAKGLAEVGAAVVINGRKPEALDAAKARLVAAVPGAKVDAVVADLATAAGVKAFV